MQKSDVKTRTTTCHVCENVYEDLCDDPVVALSCASCRQRAHVGCGTRFTWTIHSSQLERITPDDRFMQRIVELESRIPMFDNLLFLCIPCLIREGWTRCSCGEWTNPVEKTRSGQCSYCNNRVCSFKTQRCTTRIGDCPREDFATCCFHKQINRCPNVNCPATVASRSTTLNTYHCPQHLVTCGRCGVGIGCIDCLGKPDRRRRLHCDFCSAPYLQALDFFPDDLARLLYHSLFEDLDKTQRCISTQTKE